MQEHIRRAHPEHYIAKLPATEESFALMINTPPSERPRESTSQGIATTGECGAPVLEREGRWTTADRPQSTDMRGIRSTVQSRARR